MIIRYPPRILSRPDGLHSLCISCLRQTVKTKVPSQSIRRGYSRTSSIRAAVTGNTSTNTSAPRLRNEYFSANANSLLEKARAASRNGPSTSKLGETSPIGNGNTAPSTTPPPDEILPHRRKQAARRAAAAAEAEASSPSSSSSPDLVLPTNASSTLTSQASAQPTNSLRRLFPVLLALSKPRLSALVVLTAMASYSLYPVPELLSPSLMETPSLSPLTLLFLTSGTALCAASANAFNMLYEPKWDAMMTRTRNRPLVRKLISTRGAALFAILSGVVGTTALYYGVNPTVSFLGALNILLYAGVYTPMKRISVLNTWVGAIVGGIPPLMGWAAAAGQSATENGDWRELLLGERSIGGWLLASFLVAWQFPHFMALSWSIRDEYKNAGYRMLCWVNPARNGRVALRYAIVCFPLCIGLCYAGVTEWSFAITSTPVNAWLVREALRFWKLEGHKGSARGLFWASVWHLPVVMILAMVEKKGMWQRAWRAVVGNPDLEDDEDWIDEDEEEAVLSAKNVKPEVRAAAIAAIPPR